MENSTTGVCAEESSPGEVILQRREIIAGLDPRGRKERSSIEKLNFAKQRSLFTMRTGVKSGVQRGGRNM